MTFAECNEEYNDVTYFTYAVPLISLFVTAVCLLILNMVIDLGLILNVLILSIVSASVNGYLIRKRLRSVVQRNYNCGWKDAKAAVKAQASKAPVVRT